MKQSYSFRKCTIIASAALCLAGLLTASEALAAKVQRLSVTERAGTVTVNATLVGIGEKLVTTTTVSGVARDTCINKGENIPMGQNRFSVQSIDRFDTIDKNGKVEVSIVVDIPDVEISPNDPSFRCKNRNWRQVQSRDADLVEIAVVREASNTTLFKITCKEDEQGRFDCEIAG